MYTIQLSREDLNMTLGCILTARQNTASEHIKVRANELFYKVREQMREQSTKEKSKP